MRRAEAAFTLIELLAVVAVIALVTAIAVPNLGLDRRSALRDQARELGAMLELARQRSITTRRAHRVFLGLEDGFYRLEWFANDRDEGVAEGEIPIADLDLSGPIAMAAPRGDAPSYRPVPTSLGREFGLREGLFFEGIETPEGWLDSGDAVVVFQRDGTTDAAAIVIGEDDGRRIQLEVRPLLDIVRIDELES